MGRFSNSVMRALARAADMFTPGAWDFYTYTHPDGTTETIEREPAANAYYSNAFRACLLAKARPLAALPIHVYERRDGVRLETTHRFSKRLATLLRTRWNPFMTASEGVRWVMMTKDVRGEAFCRVEFDGSGMPVAIWPLAGKPDVEVANGRAAFRYQGDKFTKAGVYLQDEIVWVKSPVLDSDCLHGVSLAILAANELNLSIDLEDFYQNVVNGDATFAGWLETDQKLQQQDVDNVKQQLSDGGGVVNAGKVRVFDKGLSYKTNGQSMVDMSLVEQERWILQQTCRTLSVPPQEVFDLSNATYSNIEQGAINFANKTLVPECKALEEAFSGILWAAGYASDYVQLDMNGLLRGSYKERMDGYRIAIYAGIYCPNDVLAKEDMPPYEGGQYHLRSTAYLAIDPETGEAVRQEPGPSMGGGNPGGSGEGERDDGHGDGTEDPDARGTALAVIHADMAERIRDRYESAGDTERFREFARKVLAPLSAAYEVDGIEYDMASDIEEIING
ncbi:MAG: phage portal protein [Tractidigestivibacter sp.]|uniref:phage portal protein n=1 Tax=Tractidigestivibacter sp. TaxID=2847320 RepID=UPI002A8098D4|nr:phage portal protein [Tractidigestivibacter sp.]MCI6273956.1 phage portal protein [Coriobacteriaceae bacterium]MDY4533713.1 phage portal protein [Tractidigestivibacter sp.]